MPLMEIPVSHTLMPRMLPTDDIFGRTEHFPQELFLADMFKLSFQQVDIGDFKLKIQTTAIRA